MAKFYKLNEEIKQFIIEQKKANSELSCRGLAPLIKERFDISLSKSLINRVIKEVNLSSPVGRKIGREKAIIQPIENRQAQQEEKDFIGHFEKGSRLIANGSSFFLKAADYKLSLSNKLAQGLLAYFPSFSREVLKDILSALILQALFKDKLSLWLLVGRAVSQDSIDQYLQQLSQISLNELNKTIIQLGFHYNINNINELHEKSLQELNSYAQLNFFPSAYQILDFASMRERFYCIPAKIERKPRVLEIQLFYPASFPWGNDIVWQEDFAYAVNQFNNAQILNENGEQIMLDFTPVNS